MTISEDVASRRPMRADARRNYDKLLEAARSAFAQNGAEASLEDIARRAEVGVGTLYRHFPTRQALLESVYLEEVEALCSSAQDLSSAPPWDALTSWLDRFVDYVSTKRALGEQLLATMSPDSTVFRNCHDAIFTAGEPLLQRAQQAGVVRHDVDFIDVIRLVSGITLIKTATPEELRRLLAMALDGLRFRPADS
ncbi:MAG: TetR/AcrR family transcriptional regulator [Actinomycetota bacterium]|nr:TetR/AcrR family transcriptional regulator [Actinomycetota bacterium]